MQVFRQFLLMITFSFMVSSVMAQTTFREKFTEANVLMDEQSFELALTVWLDLVEDEPENANVNYKLGYCYYQIPSQRKLGLPYLEKALSNISNNYDPNDPAIEKAPIETYFYLAKAYHINEQLDLSEKYFDEFLGKIGKKHYLRPEVERAKEMIQNARELMANPVNVNITTLGDSVNSPGKDFGPVITPDENAIYFTSRRLRTDKSNMGIVDRLTGQYFEDIYVSYKDFDGQWSKPELLNISRINDHEATIGLSSDGQSLFIYRSTRGSGYLYESGQTDQGDWSNPMAMNDRVNSKSNETHMAISVDKQRLYFVSDRKGGFGGKDIYRCIKLPNGDWSLPQNLGPTINTPFDEEGPFIHPDDKTLYFSSQGHKSMGGYDIFYSKWLGENDWATPVNIGYPINTTDDDVFYVTTPDGKRAYYSSTRKGGQGETDIYVVEKVTEKEKVDLSGFALLKGYILVPHEQELPDGTRIVITDKSSGELVGISRPLKRNGSFVFIIPSGNSYHVEYSVDDEIHYEEDITVPASADYKEIYREIFLKPLVLADTTSREMVVLTDDILSKKIKWQLRFKDQSERVPLGIKVNYLDQEGQVAFSEYLTKDGFFTYRQLDQYNDYTLQFELEQDVEEDFNIVLLDGREETRTNFVTEDNRTFMTSDEVGPVTIEDETGSEREKVKQWRIRLTDTEAKLPLGIKVNFVDQSGEILHSTNVNEDGTFAFKKLKGDDYTIQLDYAEAIDGDLIIVLEENGIEIDRFVSTDKHAFKHDSSFPAIQANRMWHIELADAKEQLPSDIQVNFVNNAGANLYATQVKDDRTFDYRELDDEDYRIKLDYQGDVQSDMILVLKENDVELYRMVSHNNHYFALDLKTADSFSAGGKSLDEMDPKTKVRQKQRADGKTENVVPVPTVSTFKANFGYNKTAVNVKDKQFMGLIETIAAKVKTEGSVSIEIEASASKVPTTTYGSNEKLAENRAETAKYTVYKALSEKGLSNKEVKIDRLLPKVQGPEYVPGAAESRSTYEAFQYVIIRIR